MAVVERTLGRTGARVLPVSLGGEGILRTTGRAREAVPVILEALRLGVRYCDTAPAYQQSQDYYGEAFREAGARRARRACSSRRRRTSARAIGALRLLDDSLRRLGTDRLDLWQMHDLRELDEVDALCGKRRRAAGGGGGQGRRARALRRPHRPPRSATSCSRRCAASRSTTCWSRSTRPTPRYRPFVPTVVAEARRQGIGVVGMKVLAAGRLLRGGAAPPSCCATRPRSPTR